MKFRSAQGVQPSFGSASRPDPPPCRHPAGKASLLREEVRVGRQGLAGDLTLVPDPRGLVIFANGGGGSRHSPSNRRLADILHGYRLDTLMLDLLTVAEGDDHSRPLDIDLLSRRLADALQWSREGQQTGRLHAGLFGAGTGTAVALAAAAHHPGWVSAVVSCGGRPDLAMALLAGVQAPTLLIVGGHDAETLARNREAMHALRCGSRLEVVPGATHDFEQTGALETVAHLAGSWFTDQLPQRLH